MIYFLKGLDGSLLLLFTSVHVLAKKVCFFYKISNVIFVMINGWITSFFFVIQKLISLLINMPSGLQWHPLTLSRFENNTVFLIFQWWQFVDSKCTKIFKKNEYLRYFGNSISWQYCSLELNLLF